MSGFNGFIHAVADLVRAAGWPFVVAFLAYRHRAWLGKLAPGLRELFDAILYRPQAVVQTTPERCNPVEQIQALRTDTLAASAAPAVPGELPPVLQAARTPAVIAAERTILDTAEMQAVPPQARERALLTLAAALVVTGTFESVETSIWQSQLFLLQELNAAPHGIARDRLETAFYDVAATRFPVWFSNYPFDRYLSFLTSLFLINDGPVVTITDHGREYLMWRLRRRKPMKMAG